MIKVTLKERITTTMVKMQTMEVKVKMQMTVVIVPHSIHLKGGVNKQGEHQDGWQNMQQGKVFLRKKI